VDYPLWNLFLTISWFFLWVLWLMLLFWIITDVFRNRDLSGWAKAGWLVLILVLPFLGILTYMVVHGGQMQHRRNREKREDEYGSDDIVPLSDLRDRGIITEAEYEKEKARVQR